MFTTCNATLLVKYIAQNNIDPISYSVEMKYKILVHVRVTRKVECRLLTNIFISLTGMSKLYEYFTRIYRLIMNTIGATLITIVNSLKKCVFS